jgi:SAM-dependent methyltransferase
MRAQRPAGLPAAIDAVAEDLPFPDDSFDAAMAVVTVHQWRDLDRGLRELRRVARGTVVLLTFDPELVERWWLSEYAPELLAGEARRFPKLDRILDVLGSGTVSPVPIPLDCTDGFLEAYYGRPEAFLDPAVRRAQSAWEFVDAGSTARALARLRDDLALGEWDRRNWPLRTRPEFDGSLRLVTAWPA